MSQHPRHLAADCRPRCRTWAASATRISASRPRAPPMPLALRAGNLLVGNAENAAALEMTLVGGDLRIRSRRRDRAHRLRFRRRTAAVERRRYEGRARRCAAARRNPGALLSCVRGGIDVPKVMGSASTHVMTGVGGRPLRKGEVLPHRRTRPSAAAASRPAYP